MKIKDLPAHTQARMGKPVVNRKDAGVPRAIQKVSAARQKRMNDWVAAMQAGPGHFIARAFPVMANQRLHWGGKKKHTARDREQGKLIGFALRGEVQLPATIIITRYSWQLADDDNIPSAFKGARDGIADAFGVADDLESPLQFKYRQEKCPKGCAGARIQASYTQPGIPGISGGASHAHPPGAPPIAQRTCDEQQWVDQSAKALGIEAAS